MNTKHEREIAGLGERIFNLRRDKKKARHELAEEIGVSLSTLQAWENGEREPTASYILKLTTALNTDTEWLLAGIKRSKGECHQPLKIEDTDIINTKLMADIINTIETTIKDNNIKNITVLKKAKLIAIMYQAHFGKTNLNIELIKNSVMLLA